MILGLLLPIVWVRYSLVEVSRIHKDGTRLNQIFVFLPGLF